MTASHDGDRGPVRPAVAVALCAAGYVALVICGSGIASLVLDRDVIPIPGLGQAPGVVGVVSATAAVAGILAAATRRPRPTYAAAAVCAAASVVAYALGVAVTAVVVGVDPVRASAAAGIVVASWFGVVLAVAGAIAGWAGVALVRTHAARPRWPWEHDDDDG